MLSSDIVRIALGTALLVSLYKFIAEDPKATFSKDPWFMPVIFVLLWETYRE